ncbi:MAG: phosphoribosylformylglycinamidine cyclo-ligase [Ignisphaera sp.]
MFFRNLYVSILASSSVEDFAMSWSYAKAGLDLSKHKSMHNYVLELLERLAKDLGVEISGLGGYGTAIKIGSYEMMLHVDGVGTKTIVLEKLGKLKVAGWDCVAMNVNDVVCDGGIPIALVDYISMPRDDVEIFREVIDGLVEAARIAKVPILGGETAILRDLVSGVDVVCTVLAIKKNFVNEARVGDIVIGIESWGLHANGYTLVRRVLESSGYHDYRGVIDDVDLGEELSKPTAIYSNLVLELITYNLVHSIAHITGGAYTKVKRILRETDMVLDMPKPPKIFEVIMRLGNISIEEMYRVFNMGIGMIITTSLENQEEVLKIVERYGFKAHILGKVVTGDGKVRLKLFNNTLLVF